jgi:hypothetical protein
MIQAIGSLVMALLSGAMFLVTVSLGARGSARDSGRKQP